MRTLVLLLMTTMGLQSPQTINVRRSGNWSDSAARGQCIVRVWVDDEADFAIQEDRLYILTGRGEPARDAGTECTGPLPRNVGYFQITDTGGRGEIQLLEEPSARNGWRAVVRITDNRGGGREYRYRMEWERGSAFTEGRGRGNGNGGIPPGFAGNADTSRMPTRELRMEIERLLNAAGRGTDIDQVDAYIDRVRFDRWSLAQIDRDIRRRR